MKGPLFQKHKPDYSKAGTRKNKCVRLEHKSQYLTHSENFFFYPCVHLKKSFLSEFNVLQMLLKGGKSAKMYFFKWAHP